MVDQDINVQTANGWRAFNKLGMKQKATIITKEQHGSSAFEIVVDSIHSC
jgi:hypothetical protein